VQLAAHRWGIFPAVYLEGFLRVCKATSQEGCPVVCLVVWEAECQVDQVDPDPNSFRRIKARDPALCQGYPINSIHLIKATHHFNHPDHRVCPRRLEWVIQAQRRRSLC
jgi:hypothetical protein